MFLYFKNYGHPPPPSSPHTRHPTLVDAATRMSETSFFLLKFTQILMFHASVTHLQCLCLKKRKSTALLLRPLLSEASNDYNNVGWESSFMLRILANVPSLPPSSNELIILFLRLQVGGSLDSM